MIVGYLVFGFLMLPVTVFLFYASRESKQSKRSATSDYVHGRNLGVRTAFPVLLILTAGSYVLAAIEFSKSVR